MKKILAGLALALLSSSALAADNALTVTLGAGTTLRSKDVGVGVQAPSAIMVDSAGTFVGAFANYGTAPGAVSVPGVNAFVTNTPTVAQATAANLNATVVGTGTFAVQAAPTSAPAWGVNTLGSTTSGQSGVLALGAVTTGAPTYVTAQTNALSLDTAGNLRVNVVAGGGAGGTSSSFGSAFPATGTAIGLTSGTNMVAWSATTTYGTAPAAIAVPAVNAYVTNATPISQTTMANSNPVVIASDQSAVAVKSTAVATGGATTTSNIAPNNTTAVVIKASAGTLYGVQLSGIGSVPAYLKIYNSTSTCAGTPIKRFIIPVAATAANGAGSNITFGPQGVAFGTGITYCVSTDITDTNSGAPAANSYYVNIDWN